MADAVFQRDFHTFCWIPCRADLGQGSITDIGEVAPNRMPVPDHRNIGLGVFRCAVPAWSVRIPREQETPMDLFFWHCGGTRNERLATIWRRVAKADIPDWRSACASHADISLQR